MKHCHMQIEYDTPEGGVETLAGFNPNTDREHAHQMLDEFLDYLSQHFEGEDYTGNPDSRFVVFDGSHDD